MSEWKCQHCWCTSFARIDVKAPGGSFEPGDYVRCVNCKNVDFHPVSFRGQTWALTPMSGEDNGPSDGEEHE